MPEILGKILVNFFCAWHEVVSRERQICMSIFWIFFFLLGNDVMVFGLSGIDVYFVRLDDTLIGLVML